MRSLTLATRLLAPLLGPFLAAVGAAPAQSGPWQDGELVVHTFTATGETLFRINPETGHGQLLRTGFGVGGWSGGFAFDSHRGGLLANIALLPDNIYRLWLIAHDGTASIVPGFTARSLRAMAPVGDGRVYFQAHGVLTREIEYVDASNVTRRLMDQSGTAPFVLDVEHLIYHAASNALIASSINLCAPLQPSVTRIPLSADGSRVGGALTCASHGSAWDIIVSLGHLPGGRILMTLATGALGVPTERLMAIDPVTLGLSVWARPQPNDLNGGYYSARRGAAIVLDDNTNVLRVFAAGSSGLGAILATDVPVGDASSGFSPQETMWQVDVLGPGCDGFTLRYGTGLAGSGAFVPVLSSSGCPDVNRSGFSINVSDALGGTAGVLIVGATQLSVPLFGGTLLASPDVSLPIALGGATGVPGVGTLTIPLAFPNPSYRGLSLYLQAGMLDPGALQLLTLTNGLRITIG